MIDVVYTPIKKIIIHDIESLSLDDFTELNAGSTVGWNSGVIYAISYFPESDEIIDLAAKGTLHWSVVQYSLMKDYASSLQNKANIKMKVSDKSSNMPITHAMSFIKKYHKENHS